MVKFHSIPVSNRHDLHFVERGSGPPVVLLHGIPGSSATWEPVAAMLERDHRVLVPDLVGFGRSSRSLDPHLIHVHGQASMVLEGLDALGVARATVIGHDFGGPIALTLLARQPARVGALGLLATNAFTDTPIPFPLSTVTWPIVGWIARRVLFSRASLRIMLRQGVGVPHVPIDPTDAIGDRAQARAIATIFEHALLRLVELYSPVQRALSTVSVPAFVAWGDRDPFFSVAQGRRTASAIAGARFELLEGAGHFLPVERPAKVAELVARLVRDSAQQAA